MFNVPFLRTKCSSGLASALGGNNEVYLKVDSEVDSEIEERADFKACIFGKTRSTCHMFNVPFFRTKCSSGLASAFGVNKEVYLEIDSEVGEGRYFKAYFRKVSFFQKDICSKCLFEEKIGWVASVTKSSKKLSSPQGTI